MKTAKNRIDLSIAFVLLLVLCFLFLTNLSIGEAIISFEDIFSLLTGGAVENASWSYIVESRLFRSIVAILAGGALGVSGLILQVFFRNPLAGPGVLGITSGASLGVAFVIMGGVALQSTLGTWSMALAGVVGAVGVLFLLLILSRFVKQAVTLLVIGLMFGYFTSALINVLFYWSDEMATRAFVIWGLGSFEGLTPVELVRFLSIILLFLGGTIFLIRPLNALVSGPEYAASVGINVKRVRYVIILVTGGLAAIVTVYCGPISFIGIAVPQLLRLVLRAQNHAVILPLTFLGGATLALLSDVLIRFSGNALPLNTMTALLGAPVILLTIIKMNKKGAGV